jgi:hypothetical protein
MVIYIFGANFIFPVTSLYSTCPFSLFHLTKSRDQYPKILHHTDPSPPPLGAVRGKMSKIH